MFKKQKGITLISLIIYLIAMTMLIAVIANISRSFYKNMSQFSVNNELEIKIEKFNTFFLKHVNTSSISVASCTENNISFSDGSNFIYQNDAIYYKTSDKNIKICDDILDIEFKYNTMAKELEVYIADSTADRRMFYKKN